MSQINPRSNPSSAPATAAEMAAVLEQTRELAIARLTEAVRTVLAVADDALFDFMQKSGGNSNQPHFLDARSEEHTSELQSLMRISYAVFCLKKKKYHKNHQSI